MNNIKSFTFFENYKDVIEQFKNNDEKAKFLYIIYQFMFFDIEPKLEENSLMKMGWLGIKSSLETSKNRGLHNIKTKQKQNENKIKTNKKQTSSISTSISINNYFNNKELNTIFKEFLNMRKKLKAVNSERAINTLINKLNNYDDETKYRMIEQSIIKSWKDVYELKEDKPKANVPEWFDKKREETDDDRRIKELAKKFTGA